MYNLATTEYRLQNAARLLSDIVSSNAYYAFAGDYLPHANVALQPVPDITSNVYTEAWSNMIFGKKVPANGVFYMINNNEYIANTVYAMYDDSDPNLPQEQFFVITQEGSNYHVWKCLDNNFGVESLVQPLFAYISNTPYFRTADGYAWFYMTSVPVNVGELFETSSYFPVVANTVVEGMATPGTIEIFVVESNGSFYNNYISGQFAVADIAVGGQHTVFAVSNNVYNQVNGYYNGCLLYISGTSNATGQYSTVANSFSNSTGNYVQLEAVISPQPLNGDSFQITPQVALTSDGAQSINCVARALVNGSASNALYRIEVLQPGENYLRVLASDVVVSNVVGVTNTAIIRAISSPQNGHGSNVFSELYSNSIGITVQFANTEGNTIPASYIYQQIGLLNNPKFANVVFSFNSLSGVFNPGEVLYSVILTQLNANVTCNSACNVLSCNNANFVNQVPANTDFILLRASGGVGNQLVVPGDTVNSSYMFIESNAYFSCTATDMYAVEILDSCVVEITGSNTISVTNCTCNFSAGDQIVGEVSGTWGLLTSVQRNGVSEYFNNFVELYKYNVTLISGSFIAGETVTQGNNVGYIYQVISGANNVYAYLSDFEGGVFGPGNMVGTNSGAIANLTAGYLPDIVFGSAPILYIENVSPVTRANNQTETLNFVLSF